MSYIGTLIGGNLEVYWLYIREKYSTHGATMILLGTFLRRSVFFLSGLAIAGCGSSPQQQLYGTDWVSTPTAYEGTFVNDACATSKVYQSYKFEGNGLLFSVRVHPTSADCTSNANADFTSTIAGTVTVGEALSTPESTYKLDVKYNQYQILPSTAAGVAQMTTYNCSSPTITAGTEVSLLGSTCPGSLDQVGAQGFVSYTIVQLIGTSLKIGINGSATLVIGRTSDAGRPTTFIGSTYTRQ